MNAGKYLTCWEKRKKGRLARSPAAQVACLSREGASDKRRTTSVSLERFLHTRTYSGDGGISSSIDVFPSKDLQPSGIQIEGSQYCLLYENPIICWITHYRGLLYSAHDIVKKDPGRAEQHTLATAVTNFTKPEAQNKVDPCRNDRIL